MITEKETAKLCKNYKVNYSEIKESYLDNKTIIYINLSKVFFNLKNITKMMCHLNRNYIHGVCFKFII